MICKIDKLKLKNNAVSSNGTVHSMVYFLLIIFVLQILIHFVYAQRHCQVDTDCPFGQICAAMDDAGNKQCRDCITSAECLSKTFLKSTPAGGVSPWFSISMIVILISFTGVAVFYMIAYLFNSEQYKRIAFSELMQVIASFLLVGFLFGFDLFQQNLVSQLESTSGAITSALILSGGGSPATAAFAGNIQINPFDVSYAFLRNMLKCTENQLKHEFTASKVYERLMGFSLQFSFEAPVIKVATFPNIFALIPNWARLAAEHEYNANELTWLTIFLYAQIAVLKFIETSMFTVFLPIGLILRSFPPTRGAGAVLVALAIGFYFVYPLTFVLLYVGTTPVIEGCQIQAPLDITPSSQTCPVNVGAAQNLMVSAEALPIIDANTPRVEAGMNSLRFASFVYMLISLGVTFIFVRSTSSILGADISEIGRSMLRLL